MADDPTLGELWRRQHDHEERSERAHAAIDSRMTEVATKAVPLDVWQQKEAARDAELQVIRDDVKEVRDRPAMTLGKWIAVIGVVIAFLGLVVTAWAAAKGAG